MNTKIIASISAAILLLVSLIVLGAIIISDHNSIESSKKLQLNHEQPQDCKQNSNRIGFKNENLIEAYGLLTQEFKRLSNEYVKETHENKKSKLMDRMHRTQNLLESIGTVVLESSEN